MRHDLAQRVQKIACFLIVGLILAPSSHCEPIEAAKLRGGFGLECRGVTGNAFGAYFSAALDTQPVTLKLAIEADACSSQLSRASAFDFRSSMAEIRTGSFLPGPFDARLRAQFERYALSRASVLSVIPLLSFDIDVFYISAGLNFRTFSMDEGNPLDPYFSAFERQFTFEIGGRIRPTDKLVLELSIRNFDDFRAESYASIAYRLDCGLSLDPYEVGAELGVQPAGASSLSATGSGFSFRVFLGRRL